MTVEGTQKTAALILEAWHIYITALYNKEVCEYISRVIVGMVKFRQVDDRERDGRIFLREMADRWNIMRVLAVVGFGTDDAD